MNRARRGTLLIVVAGGAALLATLAIAFLARMRSDAEQVAIVVREAQARIMLVAACTYLQEASRLGWDDPATPAHEEGFGWLDVRDGLAGPKPDAGRADDSRFPVGSAARFPMDVMMRPPCAIRPLACPNPIRTPFTEPPAAPGDPDFGRPLLLAPDPQPIAATWADHLAGDARVRPGSAGLAWFRVYRVDASRFVVTCGAGGSEGFRDWADVVGQGATAEFADRAAFEDAAAGERRLWYLVEWTAAIGNPECHLVDNDLRGDIDHFQWHTMNTSHSVGVGGKPDRCQSHLVNQGGTIRWIQRLQVPPTRW